MDNPNEPQEAPPAPNPTPTPAPQEAPPAPAPQKKPRDIVDPDTGKVTHVSYERFREVNEQRRTVEELLEQTNIVELREQVKQLQQERETFKETLDLARMGFADGEGVDVARFLYGRVPESERPEGGLPAWLEAHQSNPDEAPPALRGYLAPASPSDTPAPLPRSSAGVSPKPPPADDPYTADSIKSIREEALRTGDWSKYEAARDHVMAAQRSR